MPLTALSLAALLGTLPALPALAQAQAPAGSQLAPRPLAPVAAPAPGAEEIKRVLDYHENGKDLGPVLLDLVACLKVDTTKNSPTIYNCVEPVKGPVKKGTVISAWTSWFSPKGGSYEDLSIQFLHEGVVRSTVDLKVEGGWKTRNYRATSLTKPGTWQVKVLRGDKELGAVAVTVVGEAEAPRAP